MSAASLYTMNYRKSTTNLIILIHEWIKWHALLELIAGDGSYLMNEALLMMLYTPTVNFVLVCVIVLSLNKNKYIMDGPWYSIVYEEMKTIEMYLMTYNVTLFVAKFSLIVSKIKNKCVEIKTYQLCNTEVNVQSHWTEL